MEAEPGQVEQRPRAQVVNQGQSARVGDLLQFRQAHLRDEALDAVVARMDAQDGGRLVGDGVLIVAGVRAVRRAHLDHARPAGRHHVRQADSRLRVPTGREKRPCCAPSSDSSHRRRGRFDLLGTPVDDLSVRERARRVAWVPQKTRDDVPILDYVLYGRSPTSGRRRVRRRRKFRRGRQALDDVGLADRALDGILSISGGERQRAILARALAQDAPVLCSTNRPPTWTSGSPLRPAGTGPAADHRRGVTVDRRTPRPQSCGPVRRPDLRPVRGRAYTDGPWLA